MYLLIESIKFIDGRFQNLAGHNARLNKARRELWACTNDIDVADYVKILKDVTKGIYKCTVTYNENIADAKFQAYTIRKINSLKIVTDNEIEYSYKYADRDSLNKLLAQKEECDEVLIVKHNLITDTSFSNIVFYDGTKWLTPYKPLLNGTKRQKLLREGLIEEAEITRSNLNGFSKACLINAMLDIGDITIDCKNIK